MTTGGSTRSVMSSSKLGVMRTQVVSAATANPCPPKFELGGEKASSGASGIQYRSRSRTVLAFPAMRLQLTHLERREVDARDRLA